MNEQSKVAPIERLIKVIFYTAYTLAVLISVAVGWHMGKHQVCQFYFTNPITTDCETVGSNAVAFKDALFGLGIVIAVMEGIKIMSIYVAHGTKPKDQDNWLL
jgi:hypothetical protein